MRVLALDSAMTGCSACVYDTQGGVLADQYIDISRGQAEHLMPLINDVLGKTALSYDALDMVAVTHGPGAFTGLRIGIAAAKSIGMVIAKPVVGVCGFQAVLGSYLKEKEVVEYPFYSVILETKRKDYYFQMFEGEVNQKYCDAAAMGIDEIISITSNKKCLFIGDAVQRFAKESGQDIDGYQVISPKSDVIAKLAIKKFMEKNAESVDCNPVYLRLPEIGTPKNPPRSLK